MERKQGELIDQAVKDALRQRNADVEEAVQPHPSTWAQCVVQTTPTIVQANETSDPPLLCGA